MTDSLEAEIDQLFKVPPAQLVEARKALADRLKRAGDKAGVARVKALKRAAPVAWAINQVWFTRPALLEQARAETAALRALQAQRGIEPRELARAVEQQRRAVHAVVEAGMRAWVAAGQSESGLQERKLLTTVQAWLAGKGEEAPGRMTVELEASGFDAFAGVMIAAAPVPAPVVMASPAPGVQADADEQAAQEAREEAERAALEQTRRLIAERDALAAHARELVRQSVEAQRVARQARDRAQTSVLQAEHQLAELRAELDRHDRALARADAALDDARAQQTRADEVASDARAALSARIQK